MYFAKVFVYCCINKEIPIRCRYVNIYASVGIMSVWEIAHSCCFLSLHALKCFYRFCWLADALMQRLHSVLTLVQSRLTDDCE